jgi:hypothetical protein
MGSISAYGWQPGDEVNPMKQDIKKIRYETREDEPYRVRLPGFILEEDVGLGDALKRMTSTFGLKPCGGCDRRAAQLNAWFVFSGLRHK